MRGYKNFDSDPHPGDLRHLIEIGYTENVITENGYPDPKDVVVCKVWAAVTDAGNQHYRSADVMNTEAVINFTIRYQEDIKPGMWVRFQGTNGTSPLWASIRSSAPIWASRRPSPRG